MGTGRKHGWDKFRLLSTLAILLIASTARADSDAMANFRFRGMPLGTEYSEFARRYPGATFVGDQSQERIGLKVYYATISDVADGAKFSFLDDRLFKIEIMYLPERLTKLGGLEAFSEKLITAFGKPDQNKTGEQGFVVTWRRSDLNRYAYFGNTSDAAILAVCDTLPEGVLQARRSRSADFGF
ncbi:MAG: hypothetical protein AB7O68_14845 [Pirellulales bacterium]